MELDLYQNAEMESIANPKKILLGLNLECDQAWEQALGKNLFLDLDEAFSHIRGEKSHKELIDNGT